MKLGVQYDGSWYVIMKILATKYETKYVFD